MYEHSAQAIRRRGARSGGRSGQRQGGGRREQIRLVQLMVCLLLFLTVFVGKGVFPGRLVQLRDQVLTYISADFDFRGALAELGESLAGGESVLADLGEFCVQVFGAAPAEPEEPVQKVGFQPLQPASVLAAELEFISGNPDQMERTARYVDSELLAVPLVHQEEEPQEAPPEEEAPAVVPAAGTVILTASYTGQPLPNNYTMDQLSLGELETVTPVLGHLNSVYGYRDHPIDGRYQFHGGVDIGGQTGDPIAAFSAGTVEYVGEDSSYGLYFQIDHGNGVKSFYAHCSAVTVTKGQSVAMGETVGRVGSSGAATGPHLHLELKYQKTHLNPAYYVDFLEDA